MKDNELTPAEEALRSIDGEPQESQDDKEAMAELENAANDVPTQDEPKIRSLGTIEKTDYSREDVESTNRQHGFFNLNPNDFPSKGRFYPRDIKIRFKAATVKDIRTFSALDEENPYEVDEALVDLMSNCVRVNFATRVGSWKDILEEDRVYLILAIRELTFAEGENSISFKVKCESCSTENTMEITNTNFQQRELDERIAKYYSEEDLRFNVKSKSYGTIEIKPPSIGVMRVVSRYIKSLQERKMNMKEYVPFLKALPYMVDEWRGFDEKIIEQLRLEFMRWDKNKFLFYTQLIERAAVSVKELMMKPCEKCMDPIEAEVELPSGIKGLFIESGVLDDELM